MFIEANTLYIIFLAICIFWLLFIVVIAIYMLMGDRSDEKISKGFEQLKADLQQKTDLLVQDAQSKTQSIVSDAAMRSTQIREEVTTILQDNQAYFKSEISKISQNQIEAANTLSTTFAAEYRDSLTNEKQNMVNGLHSIADQIQQAVTIDFDSFKKDLNLRTLDAEKQLQSKVEESYSKFQKELDEYKLERFKKLDNDVMQTLQKLATKAFGKVISLQDQKEFVLRALEEAKKEGLTGR